MIPTNFRLSTNDESCRKCKNTLKCSVLYCTKHLYNIPHCDAEKYICDDWQDGWIGKQYSTINGQSNKEGPIFLSIPLTDIRGK